MKRELREVDAFDADWKTLVCRAAAASAKRSTRRARWVANLRATNRALIAIGILSIVQFGFVVLAQKTVFLANALALTTFVATNVN